MQTRSKVILAIALSALVSGCATSPPDLPPDKGSSGAAPRAPVGGGKY